MIRINKHPFILKLVIVIASFAFTAVGFSANANSARIIPKGTVSVIKDGKVVSEFTQEAPLPEGSLLKCQGQCTVRMNDAYMVAESDTVFSVSQTANSNELFVQEGTVYFSVNEGRHQGRYDDRRHPQRRNGDHARQTGHPGAG